MKNLWTIMVRVHILVMNVTVLNLIQVLLTIYPQALILQVYSVRRLMMFQQIMGIHSNYDGLPEISGRN